MVLTKLVYLEDLFNRLKSESINNTYSKINQYFLSPSTNTWNTMYTGLNAFVSDNSSNEFYINLRILISDPDGTVVYDSSKKLNSSGNPINTYDNYSSKLINENHNSRLAIMTALVSSGGVGREQKWSTSTRSFEQYLAIRIGINSEAAFGCIRISIV
jgi:hypothetical protein